MEAQSTEPPKPKRTAKNDPKARERAERNKAGHLNRTIPVPTTMPGEKPAHFPGPKEGKCLNCGDTALWRQMEAHWAGDVDEDWLDPPLEWITNSPYVGSGPSLLLH